MVGIILLLLLLSRFSRVRLCATPQTAAQPGFPVPGILQARTLEWVAISFSNAWKWIVKVKSLSHVRLLVTPWTVAYQALPSVGFSRQEYWSGVPLPSPGIIQYVAFSNWLLSLSKYTFKALPCVFHGLIACLFLSLNNISLCGCSLSICLLEDILVASSFWQSWVKMLWTFCAGFCGHKFSLGQVFCGYKFLFG